MSAKGENGEVGEKERERERERERQRFTDDLRKHKKYLEAKNPEEPRKEENAKRESFLAELKSEERVGEERR